MTLARRIKPTSAITIVMIAPLDSVAASWANNTA
jgi:hypothetical protein